VRILYISGAKGADYLCDMIFHGLRSLYGADCVDVNRIDFMYRGTPYPPFYTVYGLLEDIEVDREDINAKILARHFDLIVYGSIQRCTEYFEAVRATYPRNRILLLDGEDDHVISPLRGMGVYFKRELATDDADLLPIGFCIPKEKIWNVEFDKSRLFAPCDPRDRSTYVYYGDESLYYSQYAESYYGRTMRKGGWDCCRHYEILAAGALLYFVGLEACPPRTLHFLPKDTLLEARRLADGWNDRSPLLWEGLLLNVRTALRERLTTEAMAKYILEAAAA